MSSFVFKQKTAYEMRIIDGSADGCSSDLPAEARGFVQHAGKSAPLATNAGAVNRIFPRLSGFSRALRAALRALSDSPLLLVAMPHIRCGHDAHPLSDPRGRRHLAVAGRLRREDRKSTRLNSSH